MNGKQAKRIRRAAESMTVGADAQRTKLVHRYLKRAYKAEAAGRQRPTAPWDLAAARVSRRAAYTPLHQAVDQVILDSVGVDSAR